MIYHRSGVGGDAGAGGVGGVRVWISWWVEFLLAYVCVR